MQIQSSIFGLIDVNEDKIITFDEGLPAFEDEKNFVLIHDEEFVDSIFCWLQSIIMPELTFSLLDIFALLPDYSPNIEQESLQKLGITEKDEFFVYTIATVPEDISNITVNLQGPIVINKNTLKGAQLIASNEEYTTKYKIFDELKERKQVAKC